MSAAVFEKCSLCGGVLGTFRVMVGGEAFHPRCSHDGRDIRNTDLEVALRKMTAWVALAAVAVPVGQAITQLEHNQMIADLAQARSLITKS